MKPEHTFATWFHTATGHPPYPFQTRFACDSPQFRHPSPLVGEGKGEGLLVDVLTGLGKTAIAVLGDFKGGAPIISQ